ncbi:MAG TPA: hypothetical protein PKN96_10185 [Flavobacterium sp.]|uniref:hypothetical protein n=1 Tax=Flavobacterium sp. TaxID=239 RepID=UPI002B7EDF78|nr:hypothetical protein [Flavobacterium sp.]HNP33650.1 hypothetical protein [Flavobacterium sp.]
MKKLLLFFLLSVYGNFYSQTIQVLEKGDTLQKPKYHQFIYLSDSTDISSAKFVARIKARGSLKHTTNLYYFIRNEAQRLGANAYRFENFIKTDNDVNGELILSVYFCEDETWDANSEHMPKNKIFIFGNDDMTEHKVQGYKVQDEKYEIDSGQFKVFDIKENEEIRLTKGGFTGMTLWYKRKEDGFSSFVTFSGFGINGGGASVGPGYNGVGVSFSTGKINHVEPNLAMALLKIYQEQK